MRRCDCTLLNETYSDFWRNFENEKKMCYKSNDCRTPLVVDAIATTF